MLVLVVLFELGIFNSFTLSPKMVPGSCQVNRGQYGNPSITGTCNLLPEYVMKFRARSSIIRIHMQRA